MDFPTAGNKAANCRLEIMDWTSCGRLNQPRYFDPRAGLKYFIYFFIILLCGGSTSFAGTIFVDVNEPANGDGQSWSSAYNNLQDALASAISGDEIWCATGTYRPGSLRTDTFQLKNGVSIFGGFSGNENVVEERDFINNITVLSGDINNDDDGFTNNSENSYHVVTGSGADSSAVIDGFTIKGGNANGSTPNNNGGGMFNENGSPSVRNCTLTGNSAVGDGGGISNLSSSPALTNCTFSGNSVLDEGGGIYNESSSPTLTNCTFSNNNAYKGGGIRNTSSSSPTLTNCTFSGNTATYNGGGIYNNSSSPILTNCTFSGNTAANNGGGIDNFFSSPTVTNCTFSGNSAYLGGGMYNESASPRVTNSIIWGNSATSAGDEIYNSSSNPVVTYSIVEGDSVYAGTGNLNLNPLFVDGLNGDLRVYAGSPAIDAGNNDADIDANTAEIQPLPATDLAGNDRFFDDPSISNTGNGTPPIVDIGAYEFGGYALPDPKTIFVSQAVISGNEDGSSWADAFLNLQDALAAASFGDEIWMAVGVYTPSSQSSVTSDQVDERSKSFQLKNGVSIFGGFNGTEISREERDWGTNITILSGDLNGDDAGFTNNGENSYHVVTGSSTVSSTVIDGFTIRGGNARGSYPNNNGGGMFIENGSPTVRNCTLRGNRADANGGGIYNKSSSPTLTKCTLSSNKAYSGGGISNESSSSPTLTNCTLSGNSAISAGGGLYNDSSSPRLTDCVFSNNNTGWGGGGIYNSSSSPTLINCMFSGNSATTASFGSGGNGGGIYIGSSSTTLTNCTFSGNSAVNDGGGIYNGSSSPTVTNCILWNNGSEIYNSSSALVVTYSIVEGGYSGEGNLNLNPLFVDELNDDLRVYAGSPAIDAGNNDVDIDANTAGIQPLPATDLAGNDRFFDDPSISDTGNGTPPIVDIGVYEFGGYELPDPKNIFVSQAAISGNEDGASWADAFLNLHDALAAAGFGDEIWVAAGVYTPRNQSSVNSDQVEERRKSFVLKNGVGVYGGFYGTEISREERDWSTNITILSGDLNGDDAGFTNNGENSYHVVTGSRTVSSTVIDGFTIQGGNANGSSFPDYKGGGMFIENGSPTVTNCAFSGNSSELDGGGIYNSNSSPTLTNCTFSGNSTSDEGGGIYNDSSSPRLTNCTFSNNNAVSGGGIRNISSSSPTLTNCTFSNNNAVWGGGIDNRFSSSPILTNCTFSGNTVTSDGGGIYNDSSSPTLTNCTLSGNSAVDAGGGMYNYNSSSPKVTNTIFWGNSATSTGDEIYNSSSTPVVTYSIVEGGYSGEGNLNLNSLFVDGLNGDLRVYAGSPAIDAGNNDADTDANTVGIQPLPATDLAGNDRFLDDPFTVDIGSGTPPIVDIGAYELDPFDFTIGFISGDTTEAGTTAVFTVELNSQPTADVTVSLSSADETEGVVSPTSLTFSSST